MKVYIYPCWDQVPSLFISGSWSIFNPKKRVELVKVGIYPSWDQVQYLFIPLEAGLWSIFSPEKRVEFCERVVFIPAGIRCSIYWSIFSPDKKVERAKGVLTCFTSVGPVGDTPSTGQSQNDIHYTLYKIRSFN